MIAYTHSANSIGSTIRELRIRSLLQVTIHHSSCSYSYTTLKNKPPGKNKKWLNSNTKWSVM